MNLRKLECLTPGEVKHHRTGGQAPFLRETRHDNFIMVKEQNSKGNRRLTTQVSLFVLPFFDHDLISILQIVYQIKDQQALSLFKDITYLEESRKNL